MGQMQINLLGTSFTIKSNVSDEALLRTYNFYKKLTEDVSAKSDDGTPKEGALTDPLQIAIMSGILAVDYVYKEKQRNIRLTSLLDRSRQESSGTPQDEQPKSVDQEKAELITLDMIDKIDAVL